MPAFSYTAINEAGIKKKGILSANSEREARRLVKDLQLTPLKIAESKDITKSLKVKNKDIVIMTRQLSTLLDANTPIVDALEITAKQLKNKDLICECPLIASSTGTSDLKEIISCRYLTFLCSPSGCLTYGTSLSRKNLTSTK